MRYLALFLILAGCGGGGDAPLSSSPAEQRQTTPPAAETQITASAGPDQTGPVGQLITIHGAISEPTLPVCWQLIQQPAGSQAILTVPTNDGAPLTAILTPHLPGNYIVKLGCGPPSFPDLPQQYSDEVVITATASASHLITLHFEGTFTTHGRIEGGFTYECTQGPIDTNVKNLKPNVLYRLTAWTIVVETANTIPGGEFVSGTGDTAEFCEGVCIQSVNQFLQLTFRSHQNEFSLTLLFDVRDPTPFINPPASFAEWGTFVRGTYDRENIPQALLTSGVLSSN